MRLKKNSKVRVAGLSSFFALLAILGLAVFCPMSGDTAEAASRSQRLKIDFVLRQSLASKNLTIDFFLEEGGGIDWQKVAQVLGIDFVIAKQISLGMDDLEDVTLGSTQPEPSGVLVNGKTTFKVGTNSTGGLGVYVYGKDGKTAMSSADNSIETLTKQVSGSSFETDRWGYSLAESSNTAAASLTFNPVAAEQKDEPDIIVAGNVEQSLDLTFAAKISYGTAPGTYSGGVNVYTVAGPDTPVKVNILLDEVEELKAEAAQRKQSEESGAASADVIE